MESLLLQNQQILALLAELNRGFAEQTGIYCLLVFIIGCCVGSFLNVLALRSLKEESILWPSSYCPKCNHKLSILDNIPVISWVFLQARCRYCKEPISWQYPLVELSCGLIYLGIAWVFLVQPIHISNNYFPGQDLFAAIQEGNRLMKEIVPSQLALLPTLNSPQLGIQKYGLALGAFFLASTLIAVTITDFKEKLIPHEITYPSMIIGIAFSALIRGDLLGAMAGIGASYIIFDFLAFYGLKLYLKVHAGDEEETQEDEESDGEIDESFGLAKPAVPEEPIEVMGGGDAVLSAVMAAYLGWKALALALVIGFIAGTIMGLGLLLIEMNKSGLLRECGQKSLLYAAGSGAAIGALTISIMSATGVESESLVQLALNTFGLGAFGGTMIGIVVVGNQVSKPFPFGPALALGGFVAMFLIPYYLPFN